MVRNPVRRVLMAGLLATLPTLGLAAVPKYPVRSAQNVSGDATVRAAALLADGGDCAGVLRLLDPLVGRTPPSASGARFSAQLLRMPCLAAIGRGKEVAPVLAELKAEAPDHPLVLGFQIFAEVDAGRDAEAADHLAALADSGSQALSLIPGTLWRALAQQLTIAHDYPRRERTALALARAGWVPTDHPELAEGLAIQGVGALLATGDTDQARRLLARVQRPGALWDMAIQHRYAALWPTIEARLGSQSGTAADRYARTALDRFADASADDAARLEAVRAFAALGRIEDVEAIAAPIGIVPGISENQVEIVLADAQAHSARGDTAGAIARLDPAAALDLGTTPQAAPILIALAELFHDAGRYADELALARTATTAKDTPFSSYGLAWMRRDETCALAGLGRTGEAKTAGDALKAMAPDNQGAAIEGLLCAGRDAEAAAIAVAALATPDGADRIADQFQPTDALFLHPPSSLRVQWTRLLDRAEVRAAFDRGARILPRALWPSATPRAVPALPGAAPAAGVTTT